MLKTKLQIFISALFLGSGLICGGIVHAGTFYNGTTGVACGADEIYQGIVPGTVLITSELHDHSAHHQNQRDILAKLAKLGLPISVGMEFFEYPDQALVDAYTSGHLDEAAFLQQIKWGKGQPFDFYRTQVLAPTQLGGLTVALNFPRALADKVAQGGLDALTKDERHVMPPNFERGTASYFERFREVMKDHAPDSAIENYFTAQSLWDDTMAWQASNYMTAHSAGVLMIIVGDFHVAYQDGLVARLQKRGLTHIVSLSQIDTTGLSADDRRAQIAPSPRYGARADYVFDSRESGL
jgi:uncharacterized iron-regulated protein